MLRMDKGGEFTSNEFLQYCKDNGISRQLTAPYSPQQNGVKNCTPTKSLEDITPYKALRGRKPSLHHLRVFICIAYVKVPLQDLTKLDDRSIRMVYLGSDPRSKAYRLFGQIKNRICVNRNVKFKEDETWDWEEYTKDFNLKRLKWTDFIIGNNETSGTQYISNESEDHENDVTHSNNNSDEEEPTTPNSQMSTHENSPKESTIHTPDSGADTPLTTNFDNTPVRCYRELNDIYDNTDELLLVEDEPRNYKEEAKVEKWIEAMKEEIDSINKNNTWRLTTLPKDHKAIGLKWVTQNGGEISIKQTGYAYKILRDTGMLDCNDAKIPMEKSKVDKIGLLSRFMQEPQEQHMKAINQILRYIKGTKDYGITYGHEGGNHIQGYSDNSYVINTQEGRGTTRIFFYFRNSPINWSTQKQGTVALSSCESEFIAASTHALWLKRLFSKITNTKNKKSQSTWTTNLQLH
ncbi:zinc finger, CCHC-type containing protein [Tanacetum coccineum]